MMSCFIACFSRSTFCQNKVWQRNQKSLILMQERLAGSKQRWWLSSPHVAHRGHVGQSEPTLWKLQANERGIFLCSHGVTSWNHSHGHGILNQTSNVCLRFWMGLWTWHMGYQIGCHDTPQKRPVIRWA